MKKILFTLIVILNLHTSIIADEIREFEIEGISIGDSLLDHYSEKEIIDSRDESTSDEIFLQKTFFAKNTQLYEFIQISYKKDDKKKIIYGIAGAKIFKNNFKDCLKEMSRIDIELSKLFSSAIRKEWGKYKMAGGSDGFYYPITYDFDDKSSAMVSCQKFADNMNIENNLKVAVYSSEFGIYLQKQN